MPGEGSRKAESADIRKTGRETRETRREEKRGKLSRVQNPPASYRQSPVSSIFNDSPTPAQGRGDGFAEFCRCRELEEKNNSWFF